MSTFSGKTLMITGGTGSFGNAVLNRFLDTDIKVALMGCAVNGPGEAKDADIGVAGGDGCGVIFKHGEVLKKVSENEIVDELLKEIEKL